MTRDEILAMPAGREMDALIARNVIRLEESREVGWWWINGMMEECPFYSTDITAAWQAVQAVNKPVSILESAIRDGFFCEFLVDLDTDNIVEAKADTAPLAICRAALLAVMED